MDKNRNNIISPLGYEQLIETLKNSKNLIRPQDHYCLMQVFDNCQKEYLVKVDYGDIRALSKIKWRAQKHGYSYIQIVASFEGTTIIQAREILGIRKTDTLCDHINGDPTDNRRGNLRVATHSQNMRNRASLKKDKKYKGIYYCKDRGLWAAQIFIEGKQKALGRFLTEKQAAIAYNQAAIKSYGEFAKLNKIEDDLI